jgi:hypothetical protein
VRPPFLALRRLIVSSANLIEAEGRALRVGVVKVGLSLGGVIAGMGVLAAGAGLAVTALYFGLEPEIGRAWSFLVCALACVAVAAAVVFTSLRISR